ncbi:MAG TPA: SDR family NAD(P)-dependent oxidoreductase [Phycisphaerae bacterium]|nr:SDR family NAD(P)-dependent oxidoreductase [Phycisphaerae bacterium]
MSNPSPSSKKVILITGCSSGIGFATADLLANAGHTVYATARRTESVAKLDAWSKALSGRAIADRLDVTEPASIEGVVARIKDEQGHIDCVVNNAGYGQAGPIEEVSLDAWRRQFETNLFGVAAVTQKVLPMMRSQRSGRVVNVSSVVAHLSLPMMGPYCASKHALDAMSLALRVELAPFKVKVIMIEPGPIETEFRPNVDHHLEAKGDDNSPYKRLGDAMDSYWNRSFGKTAAKPVAVARAIQKAVESKRPKTRYRITAPAKFVPHLVSHLPDRLLDRIIHWQLKLK